MIEKRRGRFFRSAAFWVFGLSLSVFLGSMWGRTVVSDGEALAEAARPLAETSQVASIVSNWLRQEMVEAGVPEGPARTAAEDVVTTPALAEAMSRLTVEVTLAAASPGPGRAVVDAATILMPAVPDLAAALSVATGAQIDEQSVAETVRSLDPIVVVAEDGERVIGPSSAAASRLGVATVLALATMLVVGWGLVATSDERLVELRKLANRVAMGALSFTVMLRLGSWVLSPRGGKAPVSEALSVIAASKWMVPFVVALIAGAFALAAHETRRVLRGRRRVALESVGSPEVSAADAVERAV
ncbi:MAG TPA: hypothetical protein VF246_08335 [Acidimicrobiia bacterium]